MIQDFFSLLFPRTCELCDQGLTKSEKLLCIKCNALLPRFIDHEETKTFLPNIIGAHIYSYVFACIKYYKKGIGQNLLQKIKYGNKPELALLLGKLLGNEIIYIKPSIDLIIPVPLHKKKLRKRGYNQSDYFAKGMSDTTGISWSRRNLTRKENNPSQTNKSRIERIHNVEGIFQVINPDEIRSKSILLVDDVITTGATLYACATALTEAGSRVMGIASIALAI
jgi:ComF family protein